MRVIAKIFGRPLGVLSDEFNERIYFQYFPEYLASGRKISPFALSFDGIAQYEKSRIFKGLFGVFADSLPDAWGEYSHRTTISHIGEKSGFNKPVGTLVRSRQEILGGNNV